MQHFPCGLILPLVSRHYLNVSETLQLPLCLLRLLMRLPLKLRCFAIATSLKATLLPIIKRPRAISQSAAACLCIRLRIAYSRVCAPLQNIFVGIERSMGLKGIHQPPLQVNAASVAINSAASSLYLAFICLRAAATACLSSIF